MGAGVRPNALTAGARLATPDGARRAVVCWGLVSRQCPGRRTSMKKATYKRLISLEPREGIEPPMADYKSAVMPFNYRGCLDSGPF
jgi:hypothetical protein